MIPNIEYQLLILRQIVRAGFIRLPTLGTGSSKAEPYMPSQPGPLGAVLDDVTMFPHGASQEEHFGEELLCPFFP